MLKLFYALALTLSLAACQTTNPTADQFTQEIETACASASTALKVLTVANDAGKLTPAQQTQILSAAGVITPVCGSPNPPTMDSLKMQAFLQAVTLLQGKARLF